MHTLIIGGYHSGKTQEAIKVALNTNKKITLLSTKEKNTYTEDKVTYLPVENNLLSLIDNISNTIIIDDIASFYCNIVDKYFKNYQDLNNNIETIEQNIRNNGKALINKIINSKNDIIIVSSIVGLGLISPTKQERLFRDELGFFNQSLSNYCQNVKLVIAGISKTIKEENPIPDKNFSISEMIALSNILQITQIKNLNNINIINSKDINIKEKLLKKGKKILINIDNNVPFINAILKETQLDKSIKVIYNIGKENQLIELNLKKYIYYQKNNTLIIIDN